MQIIIKEYQKRDHEQIKELLDLSFEEKGLLRILNSSSLKFAYSAFAEDKLVGTVFGWISSFHPHCTYFKILSNPLYSQSDVVEILLSNVEGLETIDSPLQTSIWETSINLKNVYTKNGFKEIRRTYMPILDVSDFKLENLLLSEKDYMFKSLAEISSNNELMEKLVLLVKRNYEETHKVNPTVAKGLEEWKSLVLGNDVIAKGSYVFLDTYGNDILAYSFLHESEDEHAYELGWCGSSGSNYRRIIPQLMLQHIKYSRSHDVKSIIGEFDTTDISAMEVLKVFPFAPSPTWITYQKK